MKKVNRGLVVSMDDRYSIEPRTGERWKEARIKILNAPSYPGLEGQIVPAYINKNTNPVVIISLDQGAYVYNFRVEENPEGTLVLSNDLPRGFYCSSDSNLPLQQNFEKAFSFWAEHLGEEYAKALGGALITRWKRREQYGDKYLDDSFDALFTQVEDKVKRIRINLEEGDSSDYENSIDAAGDAINYMIFILAKIINNESEDEQ